MYSNETGVLTFLASLFSLPVDWFYSNVHIPLLFLEIFTCYSFVKFDVKIFKLCLTINKLCKNLSKHANTGNSQICAIEFFF